MTGLIEMIIVRITGNIHSRKIFREKIFISLHRPEIRNCFSVHLRNQHIGTRTYVTYVYHRESCVAKESLLLSEVKNEQSVNHNDYCQPFSHLTQFLPNGEYPLFSFRSLQDLSTQPRISSLHLSNRLHLVTRPYAKSRVYTSHDPMWTVI